MGGAVVVVLGLVLAVVMGWMASDVRERYVALKKTHGRRALHSQRIISLEAWHDKYPTGVALAEEPEDAKGDLIEMAPGGVIERADGSIHFTQVGDRHPLVPRLRCVAIVDGWPKWGRESLLP